MNNNINTWECLIDLIDDYGRTCFLKGKKYTQLCDEHYVMFLNEKNRKHIVSNENWLKYFIKIE